MIHNLEEVGAVENGHILAALLAVVATYTYIIVVGKIGFKILELTFEAFLSAENVETMKPDKLCHDGIAEAPAVALH